MDRPRASFLECRTLIRQGIESNLNKENKPLSRKRNKYILKCEACVFSATGDDIGYCEVLGCGLLWFSQFFLEMLDDVYRRTQVILFIVKCSVAEHRVAVQGGELELAEMCLWMGG